MRKKTIILSANQFNLFQRVKCYIRYEEHLFDRLLEWGYYGSLKDNGFVYYTTPLCDSRGLALHWNVLLKWHSSQPATGGRGRIQANQRFSHNCQCDVTWNMNWNEIAPRKGKQFRLCGRFGPGPSPDEGGDSCMKRSGMLSSFLRV